MLVSTVVTAASSAIVLTLASQVARNMIQTLDIRRQHNNNSNIDGEAAKDEPTVLRNPLLEEPAVAGESPADRLRAMSRKDLLRVFATGRAPTPSELTDVWCSVRDDTEGEYRCEFDGELLDNNSALMTAVSARISNGLFGGKYLPWRLLGEPSKTKGPWNGKAFAKPSTTKGGGWRGINRFDSSPTSVFQRHVFDLDIVPSEILPGDDSLSLKLDYSKHQSLPISLWTSMRDELRVVELPGNGDGDGDTFLLIGMGWMGWSGGPLNCAPFLMQPCRRRSSGSGG